MLKSKNLPKSNKMELVYYLDNERPHFRSFKRQNTEKFVHNLIFEDLLLSFFISTVNYLTNIEWHN